MEEVRRLVEVECKSTYEVADELGYSQSHISRSISKYNKMNTKNPIKSRNKSEAQKNFLNKNDHQRQGSTHDDSSKKSISDSMRTLYESEEGDAIRDKISQARIDEWAEKSDEEKASILLQLKNANRAAASSGEGSKFENFIAEKLKEHGYTVDQRATYATPGKDYHVDIALAKEKLIIEIDGPTHWSAIYGEEELVKVQAKDKRKDDALHLLGWHVLRVQDNSGSCSRARWRRVFDKVQHVINNYTKKNKKPKTHYMSPSS